MDDEILYGVDEHCRLFKYRDGQWIWLLDENNAALKELKPGMTLELTLIMLI